ncbi:hypothetical protein L1987_68111 [Smallanthus sonchifolius]|uniref:Uncharacterized protein n=1 Tax=Smallanthus sonchifolius TaxID=185202 RepID=A0ACB9B4Z9_9ASTR|nr:hypothetical protein L1987_68111 [Smallanthus sonchifolius]
MIQKSTLQNKDTEIGDLLGNRRTMPSRPPPTVEKTNSRLDKWEAKQRNPFKGMKISQKSISQLVNGSVGFVQSFMPINDYILYFW